MLQYNKIDGTIDNIYGVYSLDLLKYHFPESSGYKYLCANNKYYLLSNSTSLQSYRSNTMVGDCYIINLKDYPVSTITVSLGFTGSGSSTQDGVYYIDATLSNSLYSDIGITQSTDDGETGKFFYGSKDNEYGYVLRYRNYEDYDVKFPKNTTTLNGQGTNQIYIGGSSYVPSIYGNARYSESWLGKLYIYSTYYKTEASKFYTSSTIYFETC